MSWDAKEFAEKNAGRRVHYCHKNGILDFTGRVVGYYASDVIVGKDSGSSAIGALQFNWVVPDPQHGHYYHPSMLVALTFLDGPTALPPARPSVKTESRFPHSCSRCHGPAYVGAYSFECKAGCRL